PTERPWSPAWSASTHGTSLPGDGVAGGETGVVHARVLGGCPEVPACPGASPRPGAEHAASRNDNVTDMEIENNVVLIDRSIAAVYDHVHGSRRISELGFWNYRLPLRRQRLSQDQAAFRACARPRPV